MPGPKSAFGKIPDHWAVHLAPILQGSERSHALYQRLLFHLYHRSKTTRDVLDPEWLADPDVVLAHLSDVKLSSQVMYMKAVLNLLLGLLLHAEDRGLVKARVSDIYRDWIVTYLRCQGEAKAHALRNRRIQALPPSITLQRIQQWLRQTGAAIAQWKAAPLEDPSDRKLLLQHVYIALMVGSETFPPIRAEFANMRILEHERETERAPPAGNYLVLPKKGNGRMVLQEYKMVRKYGRHEREIPLPLTNLLRRSLVLFPRQYVLALLRNGDAPWNELANLSEIFPGETPLGPSLLRAIFVRDYASHQPMARQQWIAQQMMHDIKTSFAVYQGGGGAKPPRALTRDRDRS